LKPADMGCCAFKHLAKWQVLVMLNGCLFVVASIWAMNVVTGDVKSNLKCIVDSARALLNNVNTNMSAGQQAAQLIPSNVLDDIDRALDQIDIIAVAPGVLCAIFIFAVAFTSCAGRKMGFCYPVSKCAVLLTWALIIINLIFFGVVAALGVGSQQDKAKTTWASETATCATSAASLQTQLTSAQASLVTAQAAAVLAGNTTSTVQQLASSQADLAAAQVQLNQFSLMCDCVSKTLGTLEPLAGPGLMGIVAVLFALCTINSLCCAMGCCKERPPVKVSPEA